MHPSQNALNPSLDMHRPHPEQLALPVAPSEAVQQVHRALEEYIHGEGEAAASRHELRKVWQAHWSTLGPASVGLEAPHNEHAPLATELRPGESTFIDLNLQHRSAGLEPEVLSDSAQQRILRPEDYGLWGAECVDVFGKRVNDPQYPVAYLVHERDGQVTRIEMIAVRRFGSDGPLQEARYSLYDPKVLHQRYKDQEGRSLVSTAASWGEGRVWVSSGYDNIPDSLTPTPDDNKKVTAQLATKGDTARVVITNHQSKIEPGATIKIVRPEPTATERLLAAEFQPIPEVKKPTRMAKVVKWVGAGLLGLTVLSSFQHADAFTPGQREVTSATQLLSPSDADLRVGLPRLASLYEGSGSGEQELARATDAINAYLQGDKQRLLEIQHENNFHDDWMPEAALHKIKDAKTIDELQQSFSEAVQGTNVDLRLYTGDDIDGIDRTNDVEQHTVGVDDLANMRTTVTAALGVLNLQDKDSLGNLRIVLAKNIKATGASRPHGLGEAGYYNPNKTADDKTTIVLDVNYAGGLDAILEDIAGEGDVRQTMRHEFTHYQNDQGGNDMSRDMDELNPHNGNGDESYYLGFENGQNSDTTIGGIKVANDSYDRTDSGESAAVSGQDVQKLSVDKSTATIKSLDILMREDQKQPGFLAAALTRLKGPYRASIMDKTGDILTRTMENTTEYQALAFLALFGAALLDAGARRMPRVRHYSQLRRLHRDARNAS